MKPLNKRNRKSYLQNNKNEKKNLSILKLLISYLKPNQTPHQEKNNNN